MDRDDGDALRALLRGEQVAALATLHRGEPATSMVPYALLAGGAGFVLHVSRLATHTADMLAEPAVSLLIVAPAAAAPTPHERPRASIRGRARACTPGSDEHHAAQQAYLDRFPHSEALFGFSDFTLFIVEPRSVRFVGGFARATSIQADELASILQSGT